MTAVGECDSSLATKCLELCQTLVGQGLAFHFSLKVGSSFSFSLDARDKALASVTPGKTKKKPSPSSVRRNARRKKAFLEKKQSPPSEEGVDPQAELPQQREDVFNCDICENTFSSDNGLRIHKGKTHKRQELPQPEIVRTADTVISKHVSPLLSEDLDKSLNISLQSEIEDQDISETAVNIFCHNCKKHMSPNHTCHQCGGCGKICNSRDDLGNHINTVHPLMCYLCFQFFKDKESKTKHWREIHLMNLKPTEANQGSLQKVFR